MEQDLIHNAQTYASRERLHLAERLGFGIHGIVFRAEGNLKTAGVATAMKVHRAENPYLQELAIYQRLTEAKISQVLEFNVPQLFGHDDELLILEMSIVTRPFVLDFAGAYLEAPPPFSEEIWALWESEKMDQFETRWPKVKKVLSALEQMDIYMVDVSPSNIAFLD